MRELPHPAAVAFWNSTAHANAWSTLEARNKTFDAECVACHVTGWETPGGATIGHTAKLENVQCEVCHGPGKAHAEAGGGKTLLTAQHQASNCATCHNEHHSPRFSYPTYRERILGPGHGSPLDSNAVICTPHAVHVAHRDPCFDEERSCSRRR